MTSNIYANPSGLGKLLPDTTNGWKAKQPDREYTSDTLFSLINGGAEVYRSLNVLRVLDRIYSKEDAADIIVDLFDMGSSRDAFGAFHHDIRENANTNIGQESEHQGSSLFFWKHRYFVSIVALQETPQTSKAVLALGKTIASTIPRNGSKPDIIKLLSSKNLQKEQIYYFHDLQSLERRYALGEGNPLHLDKKTEGLLARYHVTDVPTGRREERFAVVLIAGYPSLSAAKAAEKDFSTHYLNKADAGAVVQLSNKLWSGFCLTGTYLYAVLEAPNEATARHLLDSFATKKSK
ncbi:MAG: hypothetical protein GY847_27180 [Proteobacteria bacterium]|nr:hypothetical protein [Pseudomonadota bacterium]